MTPTSNTTGPIVFNANNANVNVPSVPAPGNVTLNISGTSIFNSTGAFSGNGAKLSFNIGSGASATFGGMTAGSANSTITGVVNGNLTTSSYSTNGSVDSGNLTIGNLTNNINVNLGNVNFGRGTTATGIANAGVHIKGGNVTIGTLGIGTSNSGAVMEVAGGNTTVTGTFTLGSEITAGRPGQFYITGGTFLSNSTTGVIAGQSNSTANGTGGNGTIFINGGTATFEKITLGGVQIHRQRHPGSNVANLSTPRRQPLPRLRRPPRHRRQPDRAAPQPAPLTTSNSAAASSVPKPPGPPLPT